MNLVILIFFVCASSQTFRYEKSTIVSDLSPEDCFLLGEDYLEEDSLYGLPTCAPFTDKTGVCGQYHHLHPDMVNKPSCDKKSEFAPKQCKGDRTTGRCYCFNAQGERIFGHQWWNRAGTMTCACSRKKADMGDSLYFNSLHCDRTGNYESLQCDVISEQCWCAEELTGKLVSMVVPEKAMTKLPCYNSLTTGDRYLRQCESKKFAENKIAHQFGLRGTVIHQEQFLCDDDGSFGAYTIIDGSAHCIWRDNTKIGAWQSGNNHTGVNCNCARDTKIYEEAGRRSNQKCSGNGNYETFQTQGSQTYCVDTDGHRKSPLRVNVESDALCSNYAAYH